MKHIKRKFLNQIPKSDFEKKGITFKTFSLVESKKLKVSETDDFYLVTEKDEFIKIFQFKFGGEKFAIPEPDPILIYFNNAQLGLKAIGEYKSEIFKSLGSIDIVTDEVRNYLYYFFGQASA